MGKRRRAKKIKSYLSGNISAQPIAPKESVVEKLVKAKPAAKLYAKPLFSKKPARRNPNPIVRKKKDITVTSNKPPVDLPGGAIVGPGAKNALGKPYPISTPVSVKSISKPANRVKRAAKALIKSVGFAAEGKHKKAEKWKIRHDNLTTIKLYDKPLFSKKPAKSAAKKIQRIQTLVEKGKMKKAERKAARWDRKNKKNTTQTQSDILSLKKPMQHGGTKGRRTKKESWGYGLKAILAAGAVVGSMLGGKKLVEKIKGKVTEHRMQKFGEQGVGSSYKARQFRKKFRKNN